MGDTPLKDEQGEPLFKTPEQEARFSFLADYTAQLRMMAREAIEEYEIRQEDLILICMKWATVWQGVLDVLPASEDDGSPRREGDVILAFASFQEFRLHIAALGGELEQAFDSPPLPGSVRLLVLARDGRAMMGSAYAYKPKFCH